MDKYENYDEVFFMLKKSLFFNTGNTLNDILENKRIDRYNKYCEVFTYEKKYKIGNIDISTGYALSN